MIILDDVALTSLRNNIEENMTYYRNYFEPWLDGFVEGIDDESLAPDDVLIVSEDAFSDTENAIRFYEANRTLSTTLASSDHYWTTLAHTKYYNYLKIRWNIDGKAKSSRVESRYFVRTTNQKSKARHGLTRLWWIAHLTYDEINESGDFYYYTKLATKDQELLELIIETKYIAQNKKALFAMLDVVTSVLKLLKEERIDRFNKRNLFRDTMQQINLIGSVTVWDMLTQEEAKQKLSSFVRGYLNIDENKVLIPT